MSVASATTGAAELRARLGHPVIDLDGHTVEYGPALEGYLREEGLNMRMVRQGAFPLLGPDDDGGGDASWSRDVPALDTDPSGRRVDESDVGGRAWSRAARSAWWLVPTKNTRDTATATLPRLMYERMDEFGLDFSVVFPGYALTFPDIADEDTRRKACRAVNRYNRDMFDGCRDRMEPVGVVPMNTPAEAIAELEYTVQVLGFKAICLPDYVRRPVPAAVAKDADVGRYAFWMDTYGLDSEHDYDPLWAKCLELGVSPGFHSSSIGVGSRQSISNYMYNHLGHFAAGHEALCKSLFLGGVTRRFPGLRFGFMEGGVAWGASLYADLIGHWKKRNKDVIENLNPDRVDTEQFVDLVRRYGAEPMQRLLDQTSPATLARREGPSSAVDEFAACGIERAEDIRDLFVPSFFFGCEADDPMTSTAFNAAVNPFGARLQAAFSSDISHWDVPEMNEVLEEAWECVEHGWITEDDFRDFTFTNPARFFLDTNPNFFQGTAVEQHVHELIS